MKKNKSLKLNFIMNSLLTMSSFIFPLITFPYVSRVLSPDGVGKVNFATSFMAYFVMIAQLGMPTYGVRACAAVRDDRTKLSRTVHELLFINLFMTLISYIVLFILLFTVPKLYEDRLMYIIVSSAVILSTIGTEWLYKALEQYTYITVRSLIFKIVAIIAMFLLVHKKDDYVIYGGIAIFAGGASNFCNAINLHKYVDIKYIGGYSVRPHLKSVGIFFAMACASTIYTHLDTVMLKFLSSDADVGYYSAATKIKTILVSVVTSLGTVLLPRVSYYIKQNMIDEFKRITEKALNFVFLLSTPLSVFFIIFARYGIVFLSGAEYEGAVIPMMVIMPTLLLIGITNILGIQILVPMGKEKYVLYSEIVGAIVDIVLNILLIPLWESLGAALGTLIAELSVFIVQYLILRKTVSFVFKRISYMKIIISVLVGCICSVWVIWINPIIVYDLSSSLVCFVKLLISSICFFSAYLIMLIILKEQLVLELTGQVISKFKKSK